MFARFPRTRAERRGVVLILILGMLGLLALIGVTFATFSGQARIDARNFLQSQNWPDASELMDYALAQLIDDTDNVQSAIRGHSLKRDMYGNDALFNSALAGRPGNGASMMVTGVFQMPTTTPPPQISVYDLDNNPQTFNVAGLYRCVTNIPIDDPAFYGYNFTRWVMRFPAQYSQQFNASSNPATFYVAQTHEILLDDPRDSSGFRAFYIAAFDNSYQTPAGLPASVTSHRDSTHLEAPTTYGQAPTIPYPHPASYSPVSSTERDPVDFYRTPESPIPNPPLGMPMQSTLAGGPPRPLQNDGQTFGLPLNTPFTLDGRFLHAFNGPGMDGQGVDVAADPNVQFRFGRPLSSYADFRVNGNILDGDAYRASTDRQLNTNPAYGLPNNMAGMDEDYDACDLENWFLALQSADGQVMIPSFHRPGILIYDPNAQHPFIQNRRGYDDWTEQNIFARSKILRPRNADGHSPAAFPDIKPDATGRILYDVDNDGDGASDSVWLDLGHPPQRNTEGQLYKPLYAFMIIGLNGRIPLNTAGNLQLRSLANLPIVGMPMAQHASGKGYSPSEIDPTFALQNAYDPTRPLAYTPTDNAGMNQGQGGTYNTIAGYTPGDQTGAGSGIYPQAPYWGTAGVPVSLTQLRNILAGTRKQSVLSVNGTQNLSSQDANFVMVDNQPFPLPNGVPDAGDNGYSTSFPAPIPTTTTPVTGRWGEGDDQPGALPITAYPTAGALSPMPGWPPASPNYTYTNPVRAGVSGVVTLGNPRYGDGRDDNFNTFDFFPQNTNPGLVNNGTVITTLGEAADFFDASGSLNLPVERIRRFLTPIDVMGDGLVNSFTAPFAAPGLHTPLLGGDDKGRVAFVKHFRPPGLALATPPGLLLPNPLNAPPTGQSKLIWYPATGGLSNVGSAVSPDRTTNLYHGFESARNPVVGAAGNSDLRAGMISDYTPPAGNMIPTFDQFVNTLKGQLPPASAPSVAALNEADEMSLYRPSLFDEPFGPSDLEWLYRQHDTDGPSLSSRLFDLAPISFRNPLDGARRRRLFSTETWETNSFIWANDTPLNDRQAVPPGIATNNRFFAPQSANLSALSFNDALAEKVRLSLPNLPPIVPRHLPSLAHRDRKINLNYPLPASNRYDEPVRQKWVRETYELLKMILPPKAVDTPEELAQLSQFVINIVDFRDPDSTCTRFVNTDVYYMSRPTTTAQAALDFTANTGKNGVPPIIPTGNLATVGSTNPPPPFSPLYDNDNSPYLVQYGMEYNPVALSEVLAFQYTTKGQAAPTNRMFVELINTLTEPAGGGTACDLELDGWDFVIRPDDPTGRPDPWTGQLPYITGPIKGVTTSNQALPTTGTLSADPGGLPSPVQAINAAGNVRPYVVATPLTGNEGGTAPTVNATVDLIVNTDLAGMINGNAPTKPSFQNKYYWLYLRRPANPFDTSYDAARPNENRVVVDCFRFMFNASRPDSYTTDTTGQDKVTPTPVAGDIYSLRRLQPFRGGHAVQPVPPVTGAPKYAIPAYGYTEQAAPATSGSGNWFGKYGNESSGSGSGSSAQGATGYIWHSLGGLGGSSTRDDDWDYMPFHDRDFTSVAELLLVPGCPPGLFTKQFVEAPPPIKGTNTITTPPLASVNPTPLKAPIIFKNATFDASGTQTGQPRSYPYLMDEFFYTAQSEPTLVPPSNTYQPPFNTTPGATPSPSTTPPTMVVWPDPGQGPAPLHPTTAAPTPTFPLPAVPGGGYIGGPSQAGWYRMFDFFEVPSPAQGAIGPVAQGSNYDWARQDLRPGMLNLNLIIDEEVFFGLMSESWLKTLGYVPSWTGPAYSPSQQDVDNLGDTRLNVAQIPSGGPTPKVVTQVNFNGTPNVASGNVPQGFYYMPNRGFLALDPILSNINGATRQVFDNRMKGAFSDFLKLRHGGSGYMFAYQLGDVGTPHPNAGAVAAERPFRSFSYPDVNYTIMRPAALPPTGTTALTPWMPSFSDWDTNTPPAGGSPPWFASLPPPPSGKTPFKVYVGDPGVKNPYLSMDNNPVQPPPVPARRLFEVPDVYGYVWNRDSTTDYNPPGFPHPNTMPNSPDAILPSNASGAPSSYPPYYWSPAPSSKVGFTGDPNVNWQNLSPLDQTVSPVIATLANPSVDLSAVPTVVSSVAGTVQPPWVFVPNHYLGANTKPTGQNDNREHPSFRYDWLQKVTNLATVRTHQYAVWITVGFFEVTRPGDPSLGNINPSLAYDILGQEMYIQSGKNVRYRAFFLIDRTRAVGFSPQVPGNFRDCIVYRQLIE